MVYGLQANQVPCPLLQGLQTGDGRYAQLIFLGSKGIPFSHLVDIGKLGFYKALVGEVFDIVTPSDSRKEWMRSKYGK
jgi:hypothetical protein